MLAFAAPRARFDMAREQAAQGRQDGADHNREQGLRML
jgi:hypothetical protein